METSSSSLNSFDKTIKMFSSFTKHEFTGHKKSVHSVSWNSDGKKLASGSVDQTARVRSLLTTGLSNDSIEFKGHSDSVHQLCWNPYSNDQLATASVDKTVRIWDTRGNGKSLNIINTKNENINICWSNDGNYIAAGTKNDSIVLIDTRKYQIIASHKFQFSVNEMAWTKDNLFFLFASSNGTLYLSSFIFLGTIEIMSFPNFELVHTITAHMGSCYCLQFDPTNHYIATGGADALVSLWTVDELVSLRTICNLESPIRTVSFSYDGKYLASASEDPKIDITHVDSGQHLIDIEVNAEMNSIAWNPKYYLLAYASEDKDHYGKDTGVIYCWNQ